LPILIIFVYFLRVQTKLLMQILQNIIGVMNKEEIRHYKLFINRTEKEERKDELLFDHIKKRFPDYDENKIQKKLYSSEDKNSFYRLKNRLLDDIGKSLSMHYYDADVLNTISNNLLLARLFRKKGQYKIAFHYLNKAERKAAEKENIDWLDMIYGDFIKLSHETLDINPEEYIKKRKENRSKLNKVQEIDDILAALIYRIRSSQNFAKQNTEIIELLQNTVNDFSKSREVKNSPVLRFKIYDSVSRILLQQQNFLALEKYLLKTFREFSNEKLFNQNNHDTKLQILTYLINSLFKNEKYDQSLEYAQKLKEAIQEYNGMLKDKYLFYYYNSLVINYSVKNIDKAIDILHEAKSSEVIKKLPMYNVFVYLNLAVLNFGKGQYREALKNLVKPLLEDAFTNLDEAFRFKLAVFELMIRYELKDYDYLEHKAERLKKEYKNIIGKPEYKNQFQMISILEKMMLTGNIKKDKPLLKQINALINEKQLSQDSDIINYSAWLKKKTA
jgi:tetratricopeptide (TPR) repeat protein